MEDSHGMCGICKKPILYPQESIYYLNIRNGKFAVLFHGRCLWKAPKVALHTVKEEVKL